MSSVCWVLLGNATSSKCARCGLLMGFSFATLTFFLLCSASSSFEMNCRYENSLSLLIFVIKFIKCTRFICLSAKCCWQFQNQPAQSNRKIKNPTQHKWNGTSFHISCSSGFCIAKSKSKSNSFVSFFVCAIQLIHYFTPFSLCRLASCALNAIQFIFRAHKKRACFSTHYM